MTTINEVNHGLEKKQPGEGATKVPTEAELYSIYTRREKWILTVIVAITGLFSPLPANIYFPAIPELATTFERSIEDLNLTVTVYLALQGCSPMLWGPIADRYGRRPLFLLCLVISVGANIGLALCPTNAFWLLLLLRAIQASGCASLFTLGAGVIGDIAAVEERAGFFGWFNLGPMLAPCIGPAMGGVMSEKLGWRSIFWLLTILAAACFMMILLIQPETMRALVGNGSLPTEHFIYRPLLPFLGREHRSMREHSVGTGMAVSAKPKQMMNPFRLFFYPDIAITLLYTGAVYAVNYTITSTISSAFTATYPSMTQSLIGASYLSTGFGMILGSSLTGRLQDLDYRKIRRRWNERHFVSSHFGLVGPSATTFPLEYARLRMSPLLLVVFVASVIGWGWCIQLQAPIAGPLVLQVFLGYTSIAILNSTMTLMIDIIREQSSGIIACVNIVRCGLAAALVAVIDRATQNLGYGGTYSLLGGICGLLLIGMFVEMRCGSVWRRKRDNAKVVD